MTDEELLVLRKNIAYYVGNALVDAHKAGRMPTKEDCLAAADLALMGISGCGYRLER